MPDDWLQLLLQLPDELLLNRSKKERNISAITKEKQQQKMNIFINKTKKKKNDLVRVKKEKRKTCLYYYI
jgi:hypothetical protein